MPNELTEEQKQRIAAKAKLALNARETGDPGQIAHALVELVVAALSEIPEFWQGVQRIANGDFSDISQ